MVMLYEAVACLGKLYWYQRYLRYHSELYEDADIPVAAITEICTNAIRQDRYFLLAHEAQQDYGPRRDTCAEKLCCPQSRRGHFLR